MTKQSLMTLKQYIPIVFLSIAAIALVVLGTLSAAHAQARPSAVLQHELIIENGVEVNKGQKRFHPIPLRPHNTPHNDALRTTKIGRAGVLPQRPVFKKKEPTTPPNWKEMTSLSDHKKRAGLNGSGFNRSKGNRLGPDLSAARKRGDLRRLKTLPPAPHPDFATLALNNKSIRTAEVKIRLKGLKDQKIKEADLTWRLNPLEHPIFIEKIAALEEPLSGFVNGPPSGSAYAFSEVYLIGEDGTTYAPVRIYQNRVRLPGKQIPLEDSHTNLQDWLFGTAKTYGQKEQLASLIKIQSYNQCKALGHTLVDATPRQCLLPDGTTFIKTQAKYAQANHTIIDFDTCLKAGNPIVNTFPRKCVGPGGKLYIEPPRL